MSEAKHTPTPWTFRAPANPLHPDERLDFAISPVKDPRCIAEVFGRTGENRFEPAEANATFIVKACNVHAELVAALKQAKIEMWASARDAWTVEDFKNWAVIQQIDAALAKAEAKP